MLRDVYATDVHVLYQEIFVSEKCRQKRIGQEFILVKGRWSLVYSSIVQ